jgi:hypothetical protein
MVKRAVVVGIDDYTVLDPSGNSNLNYCVRDAQAMYHLVTSAFEPGFDPSQVYYYANSSATRDNILRALRYITSVGEAGDVACFFFAGHGARVAGSNGVFYETIIPYSGDWISDWELYQIADSLEPSYVNFTIILDSCHSGGMLDLLPDTARVRTIRLMQQLIDAMVQSMSTLIPCGICLPHDQIDVIRNNISNVVLGSDGIIDLDWDQDKTLVRFAKSTLISACRFDELASEDASFGHGLLTQSFTEIVNQSNFRMDYHDLLDELRQRVQQKAQALGATQTPQIYGQQNRMEEEFLAGWTQSK